MIPHVPEEFSFRFIDERPFSIDGRNLRSVELAASPSPKQLSLIGLSRYLSVSVKRRKDRVTSVRRQHDAAPRS
jgi:hypothetical protein